MTTGDKIIRGEVIDELRRLTQVTTEWSERVGALVINHVLDVFSQDFDAGGMITRDYQVAAGCVVVDNHSAANTVTVSSAGPGGSAPRGTGTHRVGPGKSRVINIASRTVTLYGTSGDGVSVQVLTSGAIPIVGPA